jgi:hypothetical protein
MSAASTWKMSAEEEEEAAKINVDGIRRKGGSENQRREDHRAKLSRQRLKETANDGNSMAGVMKSMAKSVSGRK